MKYNLFKNCRVVINAGTENLKIDGMGAPARETPAQEMAGVNIQRTYKDYSVFMANLDGVKIGDRVRLPAFTVPAVKMDGEEVMAFDEKHINADEAIVIGKDENGDLILIFDHCLFKSAIDFNNEKRFEMTQLGQYLQSEFLRAMNDAGIPAESCGLISKEEMFGDNALEYFKKGRNRITFNFAEDFSHCYWLSTSYDVDASAAYFCGASNYGEAHCGSASNASIYVRPRFIILKS